MRQFTNNRVVSALVAVLFNREPSLVTRNLRVRSILFVLVLGIAVACARRMDSPEALEGSALFQEMVERARTLAQDPYRPPETPVTETVGNLTYGQMRGIRFRADAAIWRGEGPFELQLFHPGGGFQTPVRIYLADAETSRLLGFDPALFDYGREVEGLDLALPPDAGYAGFRVLFPMNEDHRADEVVSFLGASYFRLLGPGHVYGLSARGLGVNVADPQGEEFPDFVEFWLVEPAAEATSLTFFGLLDGPSVTGAYRFELTPGQKTGSGARGTVLAVEARLFAREDVRKLGVAALTSMYLHGTFRPHGEDDVRPRVHDSQGLLMHTRKGEWIWRPLTNGARLRVTALRDVGPRGFGLVQRDRSFDSYLDLEAQYHRRPSLWVVADEGDWGGGGVELVEIPTRSEFNDNVVVYWSPDGAMRAGEERHFRYRLVTFDHRLVGGPHPGGAITGQTLAQVLRTGVGWDGLPGEVDPPPRSQRRVVVDFAGGRLSDLSPTDSVEAVASASSGEIEELVVMSLPEGGRRATFSLRPHGDAGADIRLFLTKDDTVLTETWSYLWEPGRAW